jgi:hypothetical protein
MPISHVDRSCYMLFAAWIDGNLGKEREGQKVQKTPMCYHPRATCIQWMISSFDLVVHHHAKYNLIIRIFCTIYFIIFGSPSRPS